jgi:hypothetical protein
MSETKEQIGQICGIIGCTIGWVIPILGIILGIISYTISKKKGWGIGAMAISLIVWGITFIILMAIELGY